MAGVAHAVVGCGVVGGVWIQSFEVFARGVGRRGPLPRRGVANFLLCVTKWRVRRFVVGWGLAPLHFSGGHFEILDLDPPGSPALAIVILQQNNILKVLIID